MSAPNEASKRRLQKELLNLSTNPPPGISINADEASNNLAEWNVSLVGAESTLYDGELFQLSFKFPERYPFDSPIVVFAGSNVPVHPHVYRSRELSSQKAKNEIINKNKVKDGKIKERNRDEKKNPKNTPLSLLQQRPHLPFHPDGRLVARAVRRGYLPIHHLHALLVYGQETTARRHFLRQNLQQKPEKDQVVVSRRLRLREGLTIAITAKFIIFTSRRVRDSPSVFVFIFCTACDFC